MGTGEVLGETADHLGEDEAYGHGAEALPTGICLVVAHVGEGHDERADEREHTGDEEASVDRLQCVGLVLFRLHGEDAGDRGDHADCAAGEREHEAEGRVEADRLERRHTEDDRGNEGHLVALEEVGSHTRTVAHVVAHVVGDGGRVAGVVLGDTRFHLAHEVCTDVSSLGEDAATDAQEQRKQRTTEAEAHEDGRGGVLEDHDDHGCAEQAQADGEHACHATGAERNGERLGHRAGLGGRSGADVATGGERHTDVAGKTRRHTSEDEGDRSGETRAGEAEGIGAVRLLHGHGCDEHDHGERDEDDSDRLELTLEVRRCTFLDRQGDLFHLRRAFILVEDLFHEVEAHENGEDRGCCREQQNGPLTSPQGEYLVAAFSGKQCWHR